MAPAYAAIMAMLEESDDPHEFVHLRKKFDASTEDVDWIRALAKEGDWVILSADVRITRDTEEREAWKESCLTAFFFSAGWVDKRRHKQLEELLRYWPAIVRCAKNARVGSGFLCPFKGSDPKLMHQPDE